LRTQNTKTLGGCGYALDLTGGAYNAPQASILTGGKGFAGGPKTPPPLSAFGLKASNSCN